MHAVIESISALVVLLAAVTLIGSALLGLVDRENDRTQQALLAGTVGACAIIVPGFWAAYLGFPIRIAGAFLFYGETIVAIAVLFRLKRSPITRGAVVPVLVTTLISLFLTAWPLARYGWNWTAFGSSDWAFYLINAEALFYHGYSMAPLSAFEENRDIVSLGTLNLHTSGRQGAEILLAAVMAFFRLSAVKVYMPTMIVAQVLVVQTAMALTWYSVKSRALITMIGIAVAISPELSYGILFQLLPQQLGIALVGANVTRIFWHLSSGAGRLSCAKCALTALLVATSVLVYPELSPFMLAAIAIAVLITVLQKRGARPFLVYLVAIFVLSGLLIFPDLKPASEWMTAISTTVRVSAVGQRGLYPSYVQLEGLLDFTGLHAIGSELGQYLVALIMLVSAAFLAICLMFASIDLGIRRVPAALLVIPMFAVAVRAISNGTDFPVFKLAMYSQPFVISLLVTWVAVRLFKLGLVSTL